MTRTEISERLKRYIVTELLDGDGKDLELSTPLLQWGILDSIGIVSLLSYIEEELGINVPDDGVRPEFFESIDRISQLLDDLQHRAA